MTARPPRYCPCGKRLAHDRGGTRCRACEQELVNLRAAPSAVPADFWNTDQLRDAFDAQHMGRVARAYRKHPFHIGRYGREGIPQEVLGGWFGLTQAQVSRIENGPPIRNLDTLAHWARVLRIPPYLLWFRLPGERSPVVSRRALAHTGATPSTTQTQTGPLRLVPISSDVLNASSKDVAAMQAFRFADLQVGGGHLYASVVNYLQTEVGPRLFGGDDSTEHGTVFTAAAALTEMAGWMAHDAGRDAAAKQHFGRSLALVQVGGDHQLGAHVLGSMSHLANHLNQPDEAIALARQGQAVLQKIALNPYLEARLLAMEARGLAGLQESGECVKLLVRAEKALDRAPDVPPSPWVSRFDVGSLASETARCMRCLGDWAEAQRQAEQIVRLRPGNRTRSRALGQLTLAAALIERQKLDEACAIAQEVIDSTQSLGSCLVIGQLLELQQILQPHRANRVVAEFLICLDEALHERLWLYQWLTKDRESFPIGHQEKPQ